MKVIANIYLVLLMWGVMLATATSPEDAWNNYMAHHPMAFPSVEQAEQRKANFFATHQLIEAHNSQPGVTYELAHNSFSLLSAAEKKVYLGGRPVNNTRYARFVVGSDRAPAYLPGTIDYRTSPCLQPVKNEGSCGSCWAFATTALVEFGACIKTGKSVALSEQQLVDCTTTNSGCSGGSAVNALRYISKAGGLDTSAAYPYTSSRGGIISSCKYDPAKKGASVSASNPVISIKAGDTNTMMATLADKKLVSVTIAIASSFYSYKCGVYAEPNCGSHNGYMVVAVVGYGTLNGVPYWVIRTPWSSAFGVGGYVLMKRGVNMCQVESYAVATTVIA